MQCCLCEKEIQEKELYRKCMKCSDNNKSVVQLICTSCYGNQNKCTDCYFIMESDHQNYIIQAQQQEAAANKRKKTTTTPSQLLNLNNQQNSVEAAKKKHSESELQQVNTSNCFIILYILLF